MTLSFDRRSVLLGMASLPVLSAPAFAEDKGYAVDDIVIGEETAPLTVYEYISYTCGACGNYHMNIWPKVKEAYVDTGKVKFVIRDFYRNRADLLVGMTARCGGSKGFYPMADIFLSTQSTWQRADDVNDAVRQIARKAGLPGSRIDACLADEDYAKDLVAAWQKNMEDHSVRATPTFVINGETLTGMSSYEEFSRLLDEALG